MEGLLEQVQLRNGAVCMKVMVAPLYIGIMAVVNSGMAGVLAIVELHSRAKNPNHPFYGNTEALLKEKALVGADGQIQLDIKNIILSCYDEATMTFVNPIKSSPGV